MKSNQNAVKVEKIPVQPELIVSRRILVVEDEIEIAQAYRDILSPVAKVISIKSSRSKKEELTTDDNFIDNFEVTTVHNGEQAVQEVKKALAENKPYAMGFFDVLLGDGIDGIETVKQIHALDPHMYAVLVTAYQDRNINSIQKIFGKEFSDRWDYLNKPFSEGEILQKARNMVSMWNIRQRDIALREHLDELKKRIFDNEKTLMVAAVARNVGHEFGNILLQIMGRADLSKDGAEPEMKKALETILIATEHASKVLERFKNLVKPSDTGGSFNKINIATPIDETILLMKHELMRSRINVVVSLEGLPLVYINHTAMVQVFMNLIINATHAIGDKGKIEITGQVVDDQIEIKIHDSGPGIPEENFATIFDAFFTTKGAKGTGLGLSICKEVIEITHGGNLSVSNHPQGGAEFRILIPIDGEGEGL
ncbi:MAG: hybrid sensor histidine kinase/response regulator [Oligoflexia bacterium]|nr:hybrid sensor histidine kinase/response regulator [Oligoflexia bacterium]